MSGISDSAKFNANSSYYFPSTGNTVIGVSAVNNQAGSVKLVPDTSLTIGSSGVDTITFSTAGNPQVPSSVNASGAIAGNTVSSATSVSGVTVSASGAVTAGTSVSGATVSATGLVSGATVSATGAVSAGSLNVVGVVSGADTIAVPIDAAGSSPMVALNAYLAGVGGSRSCTVHISWTSVNVGVLQNAVSTYAVPSNTCSNTASATPFDGSQNFQGGSIGVDTQGATGARFTTFSVNPGLATPAGASYRWTIIG